MPYVLKAPPDETPLDIGRLLRFYHSIDLDPGRIRATIEQRLVVAATDAGGDRPCVFQTLKIRLTHEDRHHPPNGTEGTLQCDR